ncbi:MAG TPA: iron-sulfur cluster assembly protein [Anaeromyxobacteraceae bacterium]|nr:iron-sulfur cluster assembly protein [Anaeromyxobacteraceae bacterium]
MERREPVLLARACDATQIPSGFKVTLEKDSYVIPQQVQDGNITVMTERGGLARIAAAEAEALGPEYVELAARAAEARASRAEGPFDEAKVWEELKTVYDPEIPASIVELGLVYQVTSEPVQGGVKVSVAMTLTAPGCGVGPVLVEDVRSKLARLPGVKDVAVELVFDPPWDPSRMSEAARLTLGFL